MQFPSHKLCACFAKIINCVFCKSANQSCTANANGQRGDLYYNAKEGEVATKYFKKEYLLQNISRREDQIFLEQFTDIINT